MTAQEAAGVVAAAGRRPRQAGQRLAASYVNFYVATNRVVLPLLDERHDDEATEIVKRCFPGRDVVGVHAREILLGGGNIHCITQQVPRA
jgi:agmatine deiminase